MASEEDRALLGLEALAAAAAELCRRYHAPPRLVAHLTLVHDVALRLVREESRRWGPPLDASLLLFGAATHDPGKEVHVGRELMVQAGVPARMARFAITHATLDAEGMDNPSFPSPGAPGVAVPLRHGRPLTGAWFTSPKQLANKCNSLVS